VDRKDTYNIVIGGIAPPNATGLKRSQQWYDKRKGWKPTPEHLQALKDSRMTPEFKKKHKESLNFSPEFLAHQIQKGKVFSEEEIQKLRKPKSEKAKQNMKGPKSPDATRKGLETRGKSYPELLLISPTGEQHQIRYNLPEYCRALNLAYHSLYAYKDKGPVKKARSSNSDTHINTVGWELRSI
jgi:hypothetical protein